MKTRIQFCFVQFALACLLILSSSLPIGLSAQGPDTSDQPPNVYLPLVSTAFQSDLTVDEEVIPGQYIVILKDDALLSAGVSATASELSASLGGELLHTYDAALSGFALKVPAQLENDALAKLQNDPRVSHIEPDRIVRLEPIGASEEIVEGAELATDEAGVESAGVDAIETVQTNPTWGLDRIDQRGLPLNQQYNYSMIGSGVLVFVIDTGIRITHSQFQGRASYGVDKIDNSLPANDCNGHGTHVAGTIGGQTYGVAKGVQLVAVRVLDCNGNGTTSGVIAGVNWVTTQHNANPKIPMIANMSLGGPASSSLDSAVQNSIAAGVIYAIAGGNDNTSACQTSPARVSAAITVGATNSGDYRASFSNFGSCLDIFAPGVSI